jgi:hypothetical protein
MPGVITCITNSSLPFASPFASLFEDALRSANEKLHSKVKQRALKARRRVLRVPASEAAKKKSNRQKKLATKKSA